MEMSQILSEYSNRTSWEAMTLKWIIWITFKTKYRVSRPPMTISKLAVYYAILLTWRHSLVSVLFSGVDRSTKPLHSLEKHSLNGHFSSTPQNRIDSSGKCLAIGSFLSRQKLLDVSEEIERWRCEI
jgi:hypothetical protein